MLTAWLVLWGLGGLVLVGILLRGLLGVESVVSRADGLTLVRRVLLFSRSTPMPAASISGMEWLADDPSRTVTINGRRIPQTALAIGAGARRFTCARGIGEAEALAVIAALRQRLVVSRRQR
jgi:hypothetical protein